MKFSRYREARKDKMIIIGVAATLLKIDIVRLSDIELDRISPTKDEQHRMAALYERDVDWLSGDDDGYKFDKRDSIVRFTVHQGGIEPKRSTEGSSGYDLYAPQKVYISPRQIIVIHSSISIQLPDSTWECQVRGRSSMSKRGLWVPTGTIDSDYRGIIGVTVANITNETQIIKEGDRFAQIVFSRVEHPELKRVVALDESARGIGGFGSTGR